MVPIKLKVKTRERCAEFVSASTGYSRLLSPRPACYRPNPCLSAREMPKQVIGMTVWFFLIAISLTNTICETFALSVSSFLYLYKYDANVFVAA